MDYIVSLSIFVALMGVATTGGVALLARLRRRHAARDLEEPELPLEGGRSGHRPA